MGITPACSHHSNAPIIVGCSMLQEKQTPIGWGKAQSIDKLFTLKCKRLLQSLNNQDQTLLSWSAFSLPLLSYVMKSMGCNVASIVLTPCFWTKLYSGGAIFYWLHTHFYCVSLRLITSCTHHSCVRTVSKEENVHLPQSKCLLTVLWTHGHTENSSLVHLKSKTWFVVVPWLNLEFIHRNCHMHQPFILCCISITLCFNNS